MAVLDELITAITRRDIAALKLLLDRDLELLLARGARLDVIGAAAAGRLERVRELLGAATKRGARP